MHVVATWMLGTISAFAYSHKETKKNLRRDGYITYILIILARESIFRLGYFSGFFIFVVIALTIMLYCTFRRISLLSFYIFLRVD